MAVQAGSPVQRMLGPSREGWRPRVGEEVVRALVGSRLRGER